MGALGISEMTAFTCAFPSRPSFQALRIALAFDPLPDPKIIISITEVTLNRLILHLFNDGGRR